MLNRAAGTLKRFWREKYGNKRSKDHSRVCSQEMAGKPEFRYGMFSLSMDGNRGILTDKNNDTLTLVYDAGTKSVYVEES